jgi:hypothetical protein
MKRLQTPGKKIGLDHNSIKVNDLHQFVVAGILLDSKMSIYIPKIVKSGPLIMSQETTETEEHERVPTMQRIIDNPFLLLFIGVVVPTVFYVIWGIMEIVTIPMAP